ncbi:type IV pilin protein [Pseudoxanthomonas suwonensis]|uniref:Pilus assembly protein PilE n=1 Tax=Pseudoxanthomonas suwonensis TaxID=314722 RepID=A0A0E3Z4B3_9GAMM|nr:type IV pilin protein [Pseudoxanthomonas suwonensis]AKC88388.1 pilus assembly protein PilE [Pseudoxanthomonas suwonensis]
MTPSTQPRDHSAMSSKTGGFTLIELMIVVAVLAILAAIAFPSYQEHVRKARRAQAKADLVEYAQAAERFFSVNNTYVGFPLPSTVSPRETGATPRYNLAANLGATTFTLTATRASGPQAGDRCGDLSITNTGRKTATGPASLAECW